MASCARYSRRIEPARSHQTSSRLPHVSDGRLHTLFLGQGKEYAASDTRVELCTLSERPDHDRPVMWGDAPAHTYIQPRVWLVVVAVCLLLVVNTYAAAVKLQDRWLRERTHRVTIQLRKGQHLGVSLERGQQQLLWPMRTLQVTGLNRADLVWKAGVRTADLLLEVNDAPVESEPADAIARMQRSSEAELELCYVATDNGREQPPTVLDAIAGLCRRGRHMSSWRTEAYNQRV